MVATKSGSSYGDYLLANSGSEAQTRFASLSELFDPGTIRHLDNRGVSRGWRCLEVGGGGGSVASWLADRVGPQDMYWPLTSTLASWKC
jgi:hypothetical protein